MRAKRLVQALGIVATAVLLEASSTRAQSTTAPTAPTAPHDGQHDFDWMIGSWKASLKRLVKPLSGSKEWVEFEGTQTTVSLWGGRGVMDEFVVNSPSGKVEGLTIRLYDPTARQWYIYWANALRGRMDMPPTVGRFQDGRGEFYDQELFDGKMIFVRYVWSAITPTSAHFEQSFSEDGGKTWEVNWISDIHRSLSR
jgi:hypothetical protein